MAQVSGAQPRGNSAPLGHLCLSQLGLGVEGVVTSVLLVGVVDTTEQPAAHRIAPNTDLSC